MLYAAYKFIRVRYSNLKPLETISDHSFMYSVRRYFYRKYREIITPVSCAIADAGGLSGNLYS